VEGAATWTPNELALMKAIGQVIGIGLFMDEAFFLLRKTYNRFQNQLREKEGSLRVSSLNAFFFMLEIISSVGVDTSNLPAMIIAESCRRDFFSSPNTPTNKLLRYYESLEERTHGELYLLCLLLSGDNVKKEFDGLGELLCSLGTVCWNTKIFFLRVELLRMIRSFRNKLSGVNLEAVESMLLGWKPKGVNLEAVKIMPSGFETRIDTVNFNLVEVLAFYDLIEPLVELDDVQEEIRGILQSPECQETWEKAYGAVKNVYEFIFQGAYGEAIENLSQEDKKRLFAFATLGAPNSPHNYIPLDILLVALIQWKDPKTLPAFQKWATELNPEPWNPWVEPVCYVAACVGCSLFMDSPPKLKKLNSDEHWAWQYYGEIIFWVHKPGLSNDEINQRCIPLWEKLQNIPFEAVDPLMRLKSLRGVMDAFNFNPGKLLIDHFKEQIRNLLEFGLKNRSHLSTFFPPSFDSEKLLTQFLISQLGEIGNLNTINILEPFMESPEFGKLAVQAVKKLKGDIAN